MDYNTTGDSIKILAIIILIVLLATSIIGGVILLLYVSLLYAVITLVGGVLGSIIIFYVLYGFGVLVQNSTEIKNQLKRRK